MIKRKVSLDDILLHAISSDRIMLHECFDKSDEYHYWEWYYYQMPIKADTIVCCCSGRGIGKTAVLEAKILFHAINYPGSSCLLTTLDQGHIVPRIDKIFSTFSTRVPYKWFLSRKKGNIKRNLPAKLAMKNGYTFYAVIAGKNTEADNLRQWHTYMNIIEEAQMWTTTAEKVAKKTRNHWNEKMGSEIGWFGTNNGRVDTPFYDKNTLDPEFHNHRYTVASWLNPKYTIKELMSDLREYGGTVDSSLFKQEIRGLQGESDVGVFNPLDYGDCCVNPDGEYFYYYFHYTPELLKRREVKQYFRYDKQREFIAKSRDVWFSVDAGGRGAPTELLIWALRDDRWYLMACITLSNMDANLQAQFIDNAVTVYNPSYIAIDCTALELALVSNLKNPRLYDPLRGYNEKIVEVYFNTKIITGYEVDELGNIIYDKNGVAVPRYEMTFNFSLDLISQKMREKFFAFPETDSSLKNEIIRYKRHGNTFRGRNHKIQAIQCFVVCWWLKHNEMYLPKKQQSCGDITRMVSRIII